MKTITIPKKYGFPTLDITVNGKVYTVKSGEEITIEDHIAEAIENAIALAPKAKRYLSKIAQYVEGNLFEITANDLEGATTICPYAFYNCDTITGVTIPHGVTSIGYAAFGYCDKLVSITIPNSVSSIDDKAFAEGYSLKRVTLKALTPPTIKADTFSLVPAACVFEVPSEALNTYKSASGWSKIANQIVAIEE